MADGPMQAIAEAGVVAVLRARSAERFAAVAGALIDGGVRCVEFTLTSRGAVGALEELAGRLPAGVVLGAGTVMDAAMVDAVADAGATFVVSPAVVGEVIERCAARGLPVVPGAFTPTEIWAAWRAGASAVKLFPASAGGPGYLRAIRAPLPQVPLVPTGGVGLDEVGAYIEAGAFAVGLGNPLVGDSGEGGDLGALRRRAERVVREVAAARERLGGR